MIVTGFDFISRVTRGKAIEAKRFPGFQCMQGVLSEPVSRSGRKQSNGISGEIGMLGSTGMQKPEELSIKIDGIRQGRISSFLSGYLV